MAVAIRKEHHHPLFYDLAGIVGSGYVSDEDHVLETYSRDTSPLPPNKQGIVVRPSCIDEVVDIVNLSNTTKIPIVPSGGRASFYGTPKGLHGKGIVIDLTRINKFMEIDEPNLTATAEAGITTSEFSTRIWDAGWNVHTAIQPFYPDTLGGQLAGFCGGGDGMEMFSVGHNAHHIAGLKVVLPDGAIVQTGGGKGNNIHNKMLYDRYAGGPDLTGMFIGSAGSFGIIVEATYRIYRHTPHKKPYAYVFENFDEAWDVVLELSEIEPLPYYSIAFIPPTNFTEMLGMNKHLVLGGCKGWTEEELDAKFQIVENVFARRNGTKGTGPAVEDWKQAVMTGRRHREMGEFASPGTFAFFEYYLSRSQVKECHDVTIKFVHDRLNEAGVKFQANEGIVPSLSASWIVSNIFWIDGEDKHAQRVMQETFADATELACANGWYPDCHQGWGTRMMAKYWPKEHFQFMMRMKKAFDPNNIMNPGVWDF